MTAICDKWEAREELYNEKKRVMQEAREAAEDAERRLKMPKRAPKKREVVSVCLVQELDTPSLATKTLRAEKVRLIHLVEVAHALKRLNGNEDPTSGPFVGPTERALEAVRSSIMDSELSDTVQNLKDRKLRAPHFFFCNLPDGKTYRCSHDVSECSVSEIVAAMSCRLRERYTSRVKRIASS